MQSGDTSQARARQTLFLPITKTALRILCPPDRRDAAQPPDRPAFIFIADETLLHKKLHVFETRASAHGFRCAIEQTDS